MMYFVLTHEVARQRAIDAVKDAPSGYVVEIKEQKRNLQQNALLWALLTDISNQVDWYGRKLTNEQWKHIFSAALSKQDVVPNLAGDGFVVLGKSTSKMTKREFSDLCELIFAFGAERGVKFTQGEM